MAKKLGNLTAALLESAEDLHSAGLLSDGTYAKITLRHLGSDVSPTAEPISAEEIRSVRERAHLSQAALAKYLNLTTGYISQLERGTRQAKGPALAILMKRKTALAALPQTSASRTIPDGKIVRCSRLEKRACHAAARRHALRLPSGSSSSWAAWSIEVPPWPSSISPRRSKRAARRR